MKQYFADLHIHIGRTSAGHIVKVAASRHLTLPHIFEEAADRKGLHVIGIVDCASPPVLDDLERLVDDGVLQPAAGGGLVYDDRLIVVLGVEVEAEAAGGEAHFLCYLPDLFQARSFSRHLSRFVTNIQLSSQKARLTPGELLLLTVDHGGFFVLAHAFTPHKGYYGNCASTLTAAFSPAEKEKICAVELGLSADTSMASSISELDGKTFLSNSDAHSLQKIARECNEMVMETGDFEGLYRAILGERGRIVANYGLQPSLGKYHRTFCNDCLQNIPLNRKRQCPLCGHHRVTVGVVDRLAEVADRRPNIDKRPPYVYQVPLEFIPGAGPQTRKRLLAAFHDELHVLHRASEASLSQVVSKKVTEAIMKARQGKLSIKEGGGGIYGRIQ